MSIISTATRTRTVLSILKPSHLGGPRTSLNRVNFQLPRNLRKVFQDFTNGVSRKEYDELVCTLRDTEISDEELLKLLREAQHCTSLLNYDIRLFIQALVTLNWTCKSESVIICFKDFIHNIVSAQSAAHTRLVINELVKLFVKPVDDEFCTEWVDCKVTEECEKQFRNIHTVLKFVLETVPASEDILLKAIVNTFPYYKIASHKQESYIFNLLKMIEYQPDLRPIILQIIIDKIMILDVNASKEEITQQEEEITEVFEMEVEDKCTRKMKHPVADTLDIVMKIIYKFLKDESHDLETNTLNLLKYKNVYKELLDIFEHSILITYASHHVQFLLFYITSFHKSMGEHYLSFLWKQVTTLSSPPVIRKNSVAYLASYLARANFISLACLKLYLQEMSNWALNYIATYEGGESNCLEFDRHHVFYSVCQALFYLIAFRHKDLVDSKKKLVFLQSLNLSKIVNSQLNPLRMCLPAVVQNFAAVTRAYQLVYCYTIVEKNKRNKIPVMSRSRGSSCNNTTITLTLEMYFPFDPYKLTRTGSFIAPLYREYEADIPSETVVDKPDEDDDDDDFIQDQSMINNKNTNSSTVYDFTYSTSPGFHTNMSI